MADTFYPGFAIDAPDAKAEAREMRAYGKVVKAAIREELAGLKAARTLLKKAKPATRTLVCIAPGAGQGEVCKPGKTGAKALSAAKSELAKKQRAVESMIKKAEKRLAKVK